MPIYSGSLAEGVRAWGVSPLGVTLVASHLQELTLGPEKLPITCITNETAATHATQITDNYRALSIVIYCGWGGEAIIASQAPRDPKVSRDLIANLLR